MVQLRMAHALADCSVCNRETRCTGVGFTSDPIGTNAVVWVCLQCIQVSLDQINWEIVEQLAIGYRDPS